MSFPFTFINLSEGFNQALNQNGVVFYTITTTTQCDSKSIFSISYKVTFRFSSSCPEGNRCIEVYVQDTEPNSASYSGFIGIPDELANAQLVGISWGLENVQLVFKQGGQYKIGIASHVTSKILQIAVLNWVLADSSTLPNQTIQTNGFPLEFIKGTTFYNLYTQYLTKQQQATTQITLPDDHTWEIDFPQRSFKTPFCAYVKPVSRDENTTGNTLCIASWSTITYPQVYSYQHVEESTIPPIPYFEQIPHLPFILEIYTNGFSEVKQLVPISDSYGHTDYTEEVVALNKVNARYVIATLPQFSFESLPYLFENIVALPVIEAS